MKKYLRYVSYDEAYARSYNTGCYEHMKEQVKEYWVDREDGTVVVLLDDGLFHVNIYDEWKSGRIDEVELFIKQKLEDEKILGKKENKKNQVTEKMALGESRRKWIDENLVGRGEVEIPALGVERIGNILRYMQVRGINVLLGMVSNGEYNLVRVCNGVNLFRRLYGWGDLIDRPEYVVHKNVGGIDFLVREDHEDIYPFRIASDIHMGLMPDGGMGIKLGMGRYSVEDVMASYVNMDVNVDFRRDYEDSDGIRPFFSIDDKIVGFRPGWGFNKIIREGIQCRGEFVCAVEGRALEVSVPDKPVKVETMDRNKVNVYMQPERSEKTSKGNNDLFFSPLEKLNHQWKLEHKQIKSFIQSCVEAGIILAMDCLQATIGLICNKPVGYKSTQTSDISGRNCYLGYSIPDGGILGPKGPGGILLHYGDWEFWLSFQNVKTGEIDQQLQEFFQNYGHTVVPRVQFPDTFMERAKEGMPGYLIYSMFKHYSDTLPEQLQMEMYQLSAPEWFLAYSQIQSCVAWMTCKDLTNPAGKQRLNQAWPVATECWNKICTTDMQHEIQARMMSLLKVRCIKMGDRKYLPVAMWKHFEGQYEAALERVAQNNSAPVISQYTKWMDYLKAVQNGQEESLTGVPYNKNMWNCMDPNEGYPLYG